MIVGSHYNRFRYYDPEIGRYVSADPIGQWGGLAQDGIGHLGAPVNAPGSAVDALPASVLLGSNVYDYARANPVAFTDPSGEFAIGPALAAAVAVAVVIDIALNTTQTVDTGTGPGTGSITTSIPPPSMFTRGLPLPFFVGADITAHEGGGITGRITCDPAVAPGFLTGGGQSSQPGNL